MKEHNRQYAKTNYQKNKEAKKELYAERSRAYYEANKEKVKARQKAYYQANKERLNKRMNEYRNANRNKVNERQKTYYEKNKDKLLGAMKKRRKVKKDRQIKLLIAQLEPLVKNLNDASVVVPLIKEYLEVSVKNDDQLVRNILRLILSCIESNIVSA